MYSLILHKDILYKLYNIQKDFIQGYNLKCSSSKEYIFPQFPLWAFMESLPQSISTLTITDISHNETEVFFTLEMKEDNTSSELKIVFGTKQQDFNLNAYQEEYKISKIKNDFPIKQRIFRLGEVVFDNNQYKLFDDKWVKLK